METEICTLCLNGHTRCISTNSLVFCPAPKIKKHPYLDLNLHQWFSIQVFDDPGEVKDLREHHKIDFLCNLHVGLIYSQQSWYQWHSSWKSREISGWFWSVRCCHEEHNRKVCKISTMSSKNSIWPDSDKQDPMLKWGENNSELFATAHALQRMR